MLFSCFGPFAGLYSLSSQSLTLPGLGDPVPHFFVGSSRCCCQGLYFSGLTRFLTTLRSLWVPMGGPRATRSGLRGCPYRSHIGIRVAVKNVSFFRPGSRQVGGAPKIIPKRPSRLAPHWHLTLLPLGVPLGPIWCQVALVCPLGHRLAHLLGPMWCPSGPTCPFWGLKRGMLGQAGVCPLDFADHTYAWLLVCVCVSVARATILRIVPVSVGW